MKFVSILPFLSLLFLTSFTFDKSPIYFEVKELDFGNIKMNDTLKCFYRAKNDSKIEIPILKVDSNELKIKIYTKGPNEINFSSINKLQNNSPLISPNDSILIYVEFAPNEVGLFQRFFNVKFGNDEFIFTFKGVSIVDGKSTNLDLISLEDSSSAIAIESVIDENYCKKNITKKIDDFTDEITYRSTYLATQTLIKVIKGKTTYYFLSLRSKGSTISINEKGVYIIFDDGTKLSKPNETIDVDVESGFYEYSAFVDLSLSEVKMFEKKGIKKFRLYIYDTEVTDSDANNFKKSVNCILNSK